MSDSTFRLAFLLAFSILRLFLVIPLFASARRNRLNNLYWLSAQFLCLVIAVPFAAAGPLDNPWIFWTFISLTEISLIMFVHTTFYQGRKSPMPVFMGIAVVGMIGGIYGNAVHNFELSAWAVYPIAALIWLWHLAEAYRGYISVAHDLKTERWIKSRYTLMVTYSVTDFISAALGTLTAAGVWDTSGSAFIVLLINLISVIIQLLTWIMPSWFRRWLNRSQEAGKKDQSYEMTIAILNVFGAAMSADTGLRSMICLYSIRSTVGNIIGSEDSQAIEKHIRSMTFDEWSQLLQNPGFRTLLINTGADSASVDHAIANAHRAMVEKQSLFTLSAQ